MLGQSGPRQPVGRRWGTFIQNHANAIVACDFFTSVTATYHVLYIFVALGIGSRRILYCNVTDHSTASGHDSSSGRSFDGESDHRNLIHDRDTVFSAEVDEALNGFEGLENAGPKSDRKCILRAGNRVDVRVDECLHLG